MTKTPKFNKSDPSDCLLKAASVSDTSINCIPKERLEQIAEILLESTHKTYKYVCLNALLGKAFANNNPLVLQKGSGLDRSWDARSMCHRVLCPFEREHLDGRLGASNEPFLNKPARFTELSSKNAVRRGGDQKILETLINLLSHVDSLSQDESFSYLACALGIAKKIPTKKEKLTDLGLGEEQNDLTAYADYLLQKTFGGEMLTILTYACLRQIFREIDEFTIVPHKLNQSGASSKETLDIDIFKKGILTCGVEVKDKVFSVMDYEHAKKKVLTSNASFLFVTRDQYISRFKEDCPTFERAKYNLISIEQLIGVYRASNIEPYADFFDSVRIAIDQINATSDAVDWIRSYER